jgi:hypothetical protein
MNAQASELTFDAEIYGEDTLKTILFEMVKASQQFSFARIEPYPCDRWKISVKPEAAHVLQQVLARHPYATQLSPDGPAGEGANAYRVPVQFRSISERWIDVRADSPSAATTAALAEAERMQYAGFTAAPAQGIGAYVPDLSAILDVTDQFPVDEEPEIKPKVRPGPRP